jgi:hypothetical protein
MKLQIQNLKSQTNYNNKIINYKPEDLSFFILKIVIWNLFGIYKLIFGASVVFF